MTSEPRIYFTEFPRLRQSREHLHRKIHTSQEVLEAWVRVQVIETRIDLEQEHPARTVFIRGFQAIKRFIPLAQSGVNSTHFIGRHILAFRELPQLLQDLAGVVASAGLGIRLSEP